jgi:hypothetical protein
VYGKPSLAVTFCVTRQLKIKSEAKANAPPVEDNEPKAVSMVCGEASSRQVERVSESEIPRRRKGRFSLAFAL